MKFGKRLAAVVIGVAIAVFAGSAWAYPAAAAAACPACYGFDRIGTDLYVDAFAAPAERQAISGIVDAARARVRSFYGRLEGRPRILICVTSACYARVGGGGSSGMALLDRALLLSPRGANPVIAAHELAHIELHARLGLIQTWRRAVPQWFDEGLAVTISDDPRYLASASQRDRCLISGTNETLPPDRKAWLETAASHDLYAKAACRVSRWVAQHGGSGAVLALVGRVASGKTFDTAYR